MSWLTPPPLIEKPPPPGPRLPPPKRAGMVFVTGIMLAALIIHLLWFGALVIRFLMVRPASFFPSWFWIGESIVALLSVFVGATFSLNLLVFVQRYGVEQGWKPEDKLE
jgi:hypothetical protein